MWRVPKAAVSVIGAAMAATYATAGRLMPASGSHGGRLGRRGQWTLEMVKPVFTARIPAISPRAVVTHDHRTSSDAVNLGPYSPVKVVTYRRYSAVNLVTSNQSRLLRARASVRTH